MSQWRETVGVWRAAVAVVAVVTVLFSVSASGADAANASGIVARSHSATGGLFACFKHRVTQRGDTVGDKAPDSQHGAAHHCPCCLAAHGATAVLPTRLSTFAPPLPTPSWIAYLPATAHEPDSVASRAANWARAPPA
jgi:hypothetical protein